MRYRSQAEVATGTLVDVGKPSGSKDDRGPYRARFVADVEGYTGLLGTLYRGEYNDGLFEVDDELLPDENWSFAPTTKTFRGSSAAWQTWSYSKTRRDRNV